MTRTVMERDDLVVALAEIFRRHGYEGTSIGLIAQKTGAGRSSLYHFFPGGKVDMADAVLDHISRWFDDMVFAPLRDLHPSEAIQVMTQAVDTYFRSGRRICLMGVFSLDDSRDHFSERIAHYFDEWLSVLEACLLRGGMDDGRARQASIDILAAIQGSIVLTRATGRDGIFRETIQSSLAKYGLHPAATG